ncbi:MAG: hypothetical protein NTZ33_15400 [Bacteroidetes bacterium]|nr:hypothetical protein [Bacteroidota bacterium]
MKNNILNFFLSIIILTLVLIISENIFGQKKLRLHFISNYKKNETFQIYANDSIYVIKNNRYHLFKAIDIILPDSFKRDDRIPILIEHKFWYNFWFKNTGIEVYYEPENKYLYILRDYRQKGHYAIEAHWAYKPYRTSYDYLKMDGFYDSDSISKIFRPDKIYFNKNINK